MESFKQNYFLYFPLIKCSVFANFIKSSLKIPVKPVKTHTFLSIFNLTNWLNNLLPKLYAQKNVIPNKLNQNTY